MTDAKHPVTQSALQAFASEYLKGLGASIREDDNRWHVRLPKHVDVDFSENREFEIALTDEQSRSDGEYLLSPESEFTQQLLDEAAEMAIVGQTALTEELSDGNYQYPVWITESDVEVDQATFNPYYDRKAVCVFVRVGIETVSEYQTEFLRAVALDIESRHRLSGISEMLVEGFFNPKTIQTNEPNESVLSDELPVSSGKLKGVIADGQEIGVEEVEGEIQEVRESATRAAKLELEEYQELQEQRINDLQSEINSLSNRLQTLATDVDNADSQQDRVDALETRKEIKTEMEDLESELADLFTQKEQNYSRKQKEIFDRHAIEVNTKPVGLTLVSYERGEIDLTLKDTGQSHSMRVPYAIGGGVIDDVSCQHCDVELSGENPIRLIENRVACQNCQ